MQNRLQYENVTPIECSNAWQAGTLQEVFRIMGLDCEIERSEPEKPFDEVVQRYKVKPATGISQEFCELIWPFVSEVTSEVTSIEDVQSQVEKLFSALNKNPIGNRVFAFQHATEDTVYFFGYGTYLGEEEPYKDAGGLASVLRESGMKNPKIMLDSGDVVWGCECYWGPAWRFDEKYKNYKIVNVDLNDFRDLSKGLQN